MKSLLEQIKIRRLQLHLKQKDMMQRVGMSRQQYQRLESKGNPRLDTLDLIAKGLKSHLMLIPQEKLSVIKTILEEENWHEIDTPDSKSQMDALVDDPWQDLLDQDE